MFSFFNKNKKPEKQFEVILPTLNLYSFENKKIRYESVKSLRKIFHEVQLMVPQQLVDAVTFVEKLKDVKV